MMISASLGSLVIAATTVISLTSQIFATAYSHTNGPNVFNRKMVPANPNVSIPPGTKSSTFQQLIDHDNPDLGTFSQFYYYSDEYYGGPGYPVVLMTPGEANVTNYYTYLGPNRTSGVIAKKIKAAVVVIEHRYWGVSSPFADLSSANLQYLTLKNSVADLVNFAKTAILPFDPSGSSQAAHAPWILVGGSYSGALSAWTESVSPGTFWAYYASSSPVQAMDYWQYFVPVQEGMPKNCSKDVSLVIDHVDNIGLNGTNAQRKALQNIFGLGDLEHYDDFASALENGPWLWQGNQFYSNSGFFEFCDAVENVNGRGSHIPGPEGVGLELALAGFAAWFNQTFLPDFCDSYNYTEWKGTYNTACFDTYNPSSPMFTDWSLSNPFDRQWVWMTCNEPFGYWQDGAPSNRPTIVSRFSTEEYWVRQCGLFFPEVDGVQYGLAKGKTYDDVNRYTGGWTVPDNTTRLIYINGQYDPWREASVSSEFRPGGPLSSTDKVPVNVVPGGFHTSDLVTRNGVVNPDCKRVIDASVAQIVEWVSQWPK